MSYPRLQEAFKCPSTTKLNKVILDPENVLPDVDRKNNEWSGGK